MNFRRRFFHSAPQLDMAPMADIVFLLLIFFMISSTLVVEPGIKLKLPKAKTSEIESEDKVVVSVNKNNIIFVNQTAVRLESLEEQLRGLFLSKREKLLVLRADKEVSHGVVVEVLDKAKLAGAKKLALAAEIRK